jgi:hypothetical protein
MADIRGVKPKRRRSVPGSFVSVPIGTRSLAFGRLTPQAGVAEFFPVVSEKPIAALELIAFPTFRLRCMIHPRYFRTGGWIIYDFLPYPAIGFLPTPYLMGNLITCGTLVVGGFIEASSESRPATATELASVSPLCIYYQPTAESELRKALSALGVAKDLTA